MLVVLAVSVFRIKKIIFGKDCSFWGIRKYPALKVPAGPVCSFIAAEYVFTLN